MSRAVLSFVYTDPKVRHDGGMADQLNKPRTARARVREELTREIKESARRQLNEVGSAALSLRAVARDLGMVSSALYRYFPSRDELLTALIIDAYDSLGEAASAAEAPVRRADLTGRWLAVTRAARQWALAQPQEYALIFGSPVPGYQAPPDTIASATRVPLLLIAIVTDAVERDQTERDHASKPVERPMPKAVRADLKTLRVNAAPGLEPTRLARAVLAWTELIGSVSFELFGHLHGVISDYGAYFDYQMRGIAADLGLS
jgi:AcrR family transcriptional regulator